MVPTLIRIREYLLSYKKNSQNKIFLYAKDFNHALRKGVNQEPLDSFKIEFIWYI
jgi:hypothetical protein